MEFYTKIAGVTYSNTGSNTENRQRIIRDLLQHGMLNEGQFLRLESEPSNIYDKNAIKVLAPDGRQLGYLSKDVAATISDAMKQGRRFHAIVESVTGGTIEHVYGINIKISEQSIYETMDEDDDCDITDYEIIKNFVRASRHSFIFIESLVCPFCGGRFDDDTYNCTNCGSIREAMSAIFDFVPDDVITSITTADSETLDELRNAAKGDALAQFNMGQRYESFQWLGDARFDWATFWYERAILSDNPDAYFALAIAYHMGRGKQQDLIIAKYLYTKAIMLGNIRAAGNLAVLLLDEDNEIYDPDTGIELLHLAAEEGHKYSQYQLGLFYVHGIHVAENYLKGLTLINEAASQGLKPAIDYLNNL